MASSLETTRGDGRSAARTQRCRSTASAEELEKKDLRLEIRARLCGARMDLRRAGSTPRRQTAICCAQTWL
ncbi:hypothetical protein FA09DRAFT_329106 [Tilletiopsis washingtonensis]|uniref:Uncharacterized protein n=1 Tax=Tilletiopsis washingtonensis TaxID=58919 RepID=A0A316ZBT9_9BASI|nr:hypothetical protein FA09DRAFT_329106 [Tilletiopsis washingtonensis]PWN99170.1 hypothetical protein FA09DRAFT_329106 [Tilletiopsis washingtonensis]